MEFQLELINLQEQAYLQQELNKTDVAAWAEQQRTDIVLSHLEKRNALYASFMAGYDTFVNSLTDMEMSGKERRERIWESTRAGFVKFLGELLKEKIKQMIVESIIQKGKQATDIAATAAQAQLAKLAWATPAYLASVATGGVAAITGLSSLMANMALAKVGVEAFAKGGEFVTNKPEMIMVGEAGREHVKITPIDRPPERALSGGSTINFYNPIMTEDFTRDQIIPQIEKATRLNLA